MSLATRDDVARLYGRAAFGATRTVLDSWQNVEYADVVAAMFPPVAGGVPEVDEARRVSLESATTDQLAAQRWWLERMRTAAFPLHERMTWFWHTFFPVAYNGNPNVGDLVKQNQTIRRNALGSFRTMLEELTVDGAMLYWLSGNTNRRNFVNENYARELFELFSAGTMPQPYDENDVRQAAKALTGWVVKADRTTAFDTNRHDRSVKTICGRQVGGYPANDPREAVEYKEVVDVALTRATTARFVAFRLVSSFAYAPAVTDLLADSDPLVDAVAAALQPAWDIRAAMTVLLNHASFRTGPPALVRSPVELAVHLAKVMGIDCDPAGGLSNTNDSNVNRPILALRRMGQVPFLPPNVGGWPEARRWLSATAMLGRYSLGQYLTQASTTQNSTLVTPLPASGDLAAWTSFMGLGSLSALVRQQLQAYLASPGTSDERTRQNSVLFLILSSPQWQVM